MIWSKLARKGGLEQTSQYQVGVGDGQWSALPIADRAGTGAGRFRTNSHALAIKPEDGTTACGHGFDLQHVGVVGDTGGGHLVAVFEFTAIAANIGGGAAHVKTNQLWMHWAGKLGDRNNTTCGAGKYRFFAREGAGMGQAATALHKFQRDSAKGFLQLVYIAQ